jgi:hypothetical protein
MARSASPSEDLLQRLVNEAVVVHTKPGGFKKSGLSFHRRRGEAVQVINIQVSQGSSWDEKKFYVNVGWAFDSVCNSLGVPVLEKVKEYECDARGGRDRWESLVPNVPAAMSTNCDPSELIRTMSAGMTALIADLDTIDAIQKYRRHRWFGRFKPAEMRCVIFYLLEDDTAAWNEVLELTKLFRDRPNAPDPQRWVKTNKLERLKPNLTR